MKLTQRMDMPWFKEQIQQQLVQYHTALVAICGQRVSLSIFLSFPHCNCSSNGNIIPVTMSHSHKLSSLSPRQFTTSYSWSTWQFRFEESGRVLIVKWMALTNGRIAIGRKDEWKLMRMKPLNQEWKDEKMRFFGCSCARYCYTCNGWFCTIVQILWRAMANFL